MLRLLVDTSSDYICVVISKDDNILASQLVYAGRKISELLLEIIDNTLKSVALDINDIDEFYGGIGPGSFTGVRIGVAMVLGLASGIGKIVYGISSLDVEAVSGTKSKVKIASCLKGNIYIARDYDFANNTFSPYYLEEIICDTYDYKLINHHPLYFPKLVTAITSGRLWDFRAECLPIYLRKSEAEINLDKKSKSL